MRSVNGLKEDECFTLGLVKEAVLERAIAAELLTQVFLGGLIRHIVQPHALSGQALTKARLKVEQSGNVG